MHVLLLFPVVAVVEAMRAHDMVHGLFVGRDALLCVSCQSLRLRVEFILVLFIGY